MKDTTESKWYKTALYRQVLDMHITDEDPRFLSELNAKEYVDMLTLANVNSAVVFAVSHVGNSYYPTKIGHMHQGLKGKDFLGEVIDLCHKKGIKVVVYYSLIYNTWAYRNFPDWRMIDVDGKGMGDNSRYGVCCINSPYREHVVAQIEEICRNYEFEGIRFDMTFWPGVCYCPHCKKRFAEETGEEIPEIINWEEPKWVTFQRRREVWLNEFASLCTSTVKKLKPNVSVEHQSSTFSASWRSGVTTELSRQSDFLQGDFYGGILQASFACKLFSNLTRNKPFGFETSVAVDVGKHTTLKPKDLLKLRNYYALSHGGAFVFIDAIDPVGSLNKKTYSIMGDIFKETYSYNKYFLDCINTNPIADIAIYLSTESKFDFAEKGKKPNEPTIGIHTPHIESCLNSAEALIESHIPWTVITKENLDKLSEYQVVILPNVLMMDKEEISAFRNYVLNGGNLYASKYTSLITKDGIKQKDFLMADLFGVSYEGETKETSTYIAPTDGLEGVLTDYSEKYPLELQSTQLKVKPSSTVRILGKLTLPYTDPKDPGHFASIHSNPPGIITSYPSIVLNKVGKGKVIYVATDLERSEYHRHVFINLLKLLTGNSFSFKIDNSLPVELILFHLRNKKQYILNLLTFQDRPPYLPIYNIKIKVRIGGKTVKQLLILPREEKMNFQVSEEYIEFLVPKLDIFAMFRLDYE